VSELIAADAIKKRVSEMAAEISRDYVDRNPVVVAILKGSFVFLADLMRAVSVPGEVDFLAVASYEGTETTGVVRLVKDLKTAITDRHVLVVEDIIDTGLTWDYIRRILLDRRPRSLALAALLDKKERRKVDVAPDYVGFTIPDRFVVGYGLDYEESYRHLPYIGVLEEEGV
jgi:hypoxanthine phosphoribosyltransferase